MSLFSGPIVNNSLHSVHVTPKKEMLVVCYLLSKACSTSEMTFLWCHHTLPSNHLSYKDHFFLNEWTTKHVGRWICITMQALAPVFSIWEKRWFKIRKQSLPVARAVDGGGPASPPLFWLIAAAFCSLEDGSCSSLGRRSYTDSRGNQTEKSIKSQTVKRSKSK